MNRIVLKVALLAVLFDPLHVSGSMVSVQLEDIDSGLTSPAGNYRWMDVDDQLYSADYQDSYNYTQATVTVDFSDCAVALHGTLTASNLKPNFAYQFKLVGQPEAHPDANERIGLTGRWWQESWNGTAWAGGANLNDKGSGSPPNPNDLTYFSRRDISDATSPTGKLYRFSAYLVFDYFITDENGNAVLDFYADDSYHVLWKTSQRAPGTSDGPVRARTFEVTLPDPVGAYDTAYAETTVGIFGEWERLPPDAVMLPPGNYTADLLLTEESFHGGGLAGGWAAAMGNEVNFNILSESEARARCWDELGNGNWGDVYAGTGNSHWLNTCHQPVIDLPDATNDVAVRTNTVTVTAERSARTLGIESGGVVVDPTGTLTVTEAVAVAEGATLEVAGTLNADFLTTAGTTTFAEGSLGTVNTINVIGGTATLSGPNVNTINATGGILNVAASVARLNVDGGTVNTTAEVSATNLEIASGSVNLQGGDLNVGTMRVAGGVVDTGPNQVVVSDTLKIGDRAIINITDATFNVNTSNLADPAVADNLTLDGGRLFIAGRTVAPPGAIAVWRFEERSGTTAADWSGAGNDHLGTLSGAELSREDPDHPTALRFDRDDGDDYVEVANAGDILFSSPFTIAMWIKTSEKGVELLGKGNGDGKWKYVDKALCVEPGTGQVKFTSPLSGSILSTTAVDVADDQWHHVVVTFDGSTTPGDQEIYVDALNRTEDRFYTGGSEMGEVVRLGSAETSELQGYRAYDGLIDDVYLYDRSLSAAEVADLYQAFSSVLDPMPNTNLRVTADSALHLETAAEEAILGDLALDAGAGLELTGAAVRYDDLTAGDGSSTEGDLRVGGTLSPGDSLGTLGVVGNLTMQSGSTYQWELGTADSDRVNVEDGTLLLETGWKLQLQALGGRAVGPGEQLYLFTFGEAGSLEGASDLAMDWQGALELLGDGWDPGNASWNPTLQGDATGVYITGVVAVPEPSALLLLAGGGLCLLLRRRRTRRQRTVE